MANNSEQQITVPIKTTEKNQFDLEKVHRLLTNSLKEDEDVLLSLYLEAYREINRFFEAMGNVFGFVSSEINQKVDILDNLIKNSNRNHDLAENHEHNTVPNGNVVADTEPFESFGSMIDYEKNNDLLGKKNYVSGTRTLLRLHRGLDFIREFLGDLAKLEPETKVSECCQTAYNNTLAKFHPWIIRKGAVLAMYTMPTRQQLLMRVCETEENIEKTLSVLPEMLKITNEVYNRTQIMYEKHELLTLD